MDFRTLGAVHGLVGYDVFIVSLLNMCHSWGGRSGYVLLTAMILYTVCALSTWLFFNESESGLSWTRLNKMVIAITLIITGSLIIAGCAMNYNNGHVYAITAQLLSAAYAIASGVFFIIETLV